MRKSSSDNKNGVKVTAKEMEKLLDVLKPSIKSVVKEGVEQYIGKAVMLSNRHSLREFLKCP
jgi:hypothetical protein